jgi:hypothetical protein
MAKKGRRFRLSKETTEEVSPSPIVFVQRGRGDCHYPVARVAACRWDVTICIRMPHTALRLSAGHNSPCQGRARGQAGCDPGSSGHGCCPADPSKMTHKRHAGEHSVASVKPTTTRPSRPIRLLRRRSRVAPAAPGSRAVLRILIGVVRAGLASPMALYKTPGRTKVG